MLRVHNIKVHPPDVLNLEQISKTGGIPAEKIRAYKISRQAVDARRKNDVHMVYSVDVEAEEEQRYISPKAALVKEQRYVPPEGQALSKRPLVIGSGPAGLFCALMLAYGGHAPIVIERGYDVDRRRGAVQRFWETGVLDEQSNVQFGEGGAGTFSDGKLTTGIRDIRCRRVLEEFCRFGAGEEILYLAKPHIGTDRLISIVKNMRLEIERLGGVFRFGHKLVGIRQRNNRVAGAVIEQQGSTYELETEDVVLAIGHSARDTFEMLLDAGVSMEQKAFSVGVRIEHPREMIDRIQYGPAHIYYGAADYKLAAHLPEGRGVYTFCMCPGGQVVAAASERGCVVTNGMSYAARDGTNSNAAVLVGVTPEDFANGHPLAGVQLQREIEQAAFRAAGRTYRAPAQLVGTFLGQSTSNYKHTVFPTYLPGVEWCGFNAVFPSFITGALKMGILALDRKMHGFADKNAVLTGPETRSSSPVRILRDADTLQARLQGLYPCGEGAGYAGGIMSAAVDGIRVFEAILRRNEHVKRN